MALFTLKSIFIFFLSHFYLFPVINGACKIPEIYWGDWYTKEQGIERNVIINADTMSHETYSGNCEEMQQIQGTMDAEGHFNSYVLFLNPTSSCFVCWQILFRTPNIIQYRESSTPCQGTPTLNVCEEINIGEGTGSKTLFKKSLDKVNCKATFEGIYHFSYEISVGGGGICDHPDSFIIACQLPGSQYIDNEVFKFDFADCPHVVHDSPDDQVFFSSNHRFQCMGTWEDGDNLFTAIADLGEENPERRFRCMLTRDDQQLPRNLQRWTMSRRPECSTLKTTYIGDIRLILQPSLLADQEKSVYGSQLVDSTCNLPLNFTGTWFTSGEFDTDVSINTTHIYFKTKIDQYTYRETYFTCQQNRDTRFLMTAVTVGKCEIDYVCFDFEPRHHNIIRWRMGKPYRLIPGEENQPMFLERKFRQACVWSSFTIDRDETDWKYNVFFLNPPAPVECPIGGRYRFIQTGDEGEKYVTRVRGITERPRHQIGCRDNVTEIKSCASTQKKLLVDADYCNTVDHTGRPIGEYEEPDRELNCIGFWMEDMVSYMITYDEEDAVSKFRCWVYERLDWRDFILSRSTRAVCGRHQTARSFRPDEGSSLSLELKESERLWDDCPQRYLDGSDPYASETKIYVLGSAGFMCASFYLTFFSLIIVMLT